MSNIEKDWFVRFDYDHWCQGYEDATETILVRASDFSEACKKIQKSPRYHNSRNFKNLTIE